MDIYNNVVELEEVGYSEGRIRVNEVVTNDVQEGQFLNCFHIPKSYFNAVEDDLKPRMLNDAFRRIQPQSTIMLDMNKDGSLEGILPQWKFDANLPTLLKDQTEKVSRVVEDNPNYQQSHLDKFDLGDSLFIVNLYVNLELYGTRAPSVGLRFLREVCVNGITSSVLELKHDTENFHTDFKAFLKGYSEIVKEVPRALEHMKTRVLQVPLGQQPWFDRLPKKLKENAGSYLALIEGRDEKVCSEFPCELKDTAYGHVNVVSASARSMNFRNRANVEAKVMEKVLEYV